MDFMRPASQPCPNCSASVPLPPAKDVAGRFLVTCPNCGETFYLDRQAAAKSDPGGATSSGLEYLQIPGYTLGRRLGKGGMASVYSAVQNSTNRLVAIKVLPPAYSANPDLVLRFERESRMLAALTHPNIVQILDRGRSGNISYLVMEYILGWTLKDRLEAEPLGAGEAREILTRTGEAIQYCHDQGLVHRDLKPGNIMLTDHGEVKVTDFGISGLLRRLGDLTEQGAMIGTPQYVAPEQLRDGSRVDPRADQYALAVIAYEMLTNALPVGAFETPSSLNPSIPREVDAILRKALAPNPADRFRSVREFVHEFRRALQPAEAPSAPAAVGGAASAGGASRATTSLALLGGETPPLALRPSIHRASRLIHAETSGSAAVFLAAARIPSGQWILDPAIFEGAETARRLERLPLALVEAAVAQEGGRAWVWREGVGAARIVRESEPGAPARLALCLAAPFEPEDFQRFLRDAELLEDGNAAPTGPGIAPLEEAPESPPPAGAPPPLAILGAPGHPGIFCVAENAERDGENRFLIDARGEGALPSWLSFSLVRAARSRGVARAASPAPAGGGGSETVEFCVFRLDFALTGDWRRYEIRWRRPEAPDAPRGKVVLAAEQGICHVAAARHG